MEELVSPVSVTNPNPDPRFWKGRKVLVTGHTGFKGSWLALWLSRLGAEISGFSLAPPTQPNLFESAAVGDVLAMGGDFRGDLSDAPAVRHAMDIAAPEIVFHLAAQPLVREGYRIPRDTWRTNVMGTLELLEAVREAGTVKTVVVITTDKVYENPERGEPFREGDPLGGHDPYASSKAACEILCASWRKSFLNPGERAVRLVTARAGNVIGGGDFAADRLLPDLIRAWHSHQPLRLRYPEAIRPWQHVFEPLAGYLLLAEKLGKPEIDVAEAYNFGPSERDIRTVGEVADAVCRVMDSAWEREFAPQPHESGVLTLNSDLARKTLGWRPRLSLETALDWTSRWYRAWGRGEDLKALSRRQIEDYLFLNPPTGSG